MHMKFIKGCNSKQILTVFDCRIISQMFVYCLLYNGLVKRSVLICTEYALRTSSRH